MEEAIRAIGYKRNAIARSLKTGRTQTVGVVIGDITNPFYPDVVAAIQQVPSYKAKTLADMGVTSVYAPAAA